MLVVEQLKVGSCFLLPCPEGQGRRKQISCSYFKIKKFSSLTMDEMDKVYKVALIFPKGFCLAACAWAQQYGPVPPRPQQFAGATLIQPSRPNFRQRAPSPRVIPEIIQPVEQLQLSRGRRPQPLRKIKPQSPQSQVLEQQRTNLIDDVSVPFPNKVAAPTPLPQFQQQIPKLLTPRPVEEEVIEDEEIPTTIVTTPSTTAYTAPLRTNFPPGQGASSLQPNQPISAFQRPQYTQPTAFRPPVDQPVQPVPFSEAALQGRPLLRQQGRAIQPVQVPVSRPTNQQIITPQIPVNSESIPQDDQYLRQVQSRPFKKQEPVRSQISDREPSRTNFQRQSEVIRQQPIRSQTDVIRPTTSQRERKPIVQTIRKYHEEHEDGSITWGYENDDGSFKEETIGVDCVTRGKYGYFDPDGVKREYTYQTGIPCNKAEESEEAASNQGFIDYTNNKYVLPNGDEIDLEAMVKNRARKPVPRYRN